MFGRMKQPVPPLATESFVGELRSLRAARDRYHAREIVLCQQISQVQKKLAGNRRQIRVLMEFRKRVRMLADSLEGAAPVYGPEYTPLNRIQAGLDRLMKRIEELEAAIAVEE